VEGTISGLTAEQTYHYRMVVETENGVRRGKDQTFYLNAVYGASTDPASNLVTGSSTGGGGAALNGSFLGDGNDTSYRFEYVPIDAYNPLAQNPYAAGQTTAGADAGSGSGVQQVSSSVTGLTTGTPYHYRLVATNQYGTTYGPDRAFISAPANPPSIIGTSASGVTDTSATFEAEVNPGYGPTVVRFEYGPTSDLGSQTFPTEPIGSDGVAHSVAAEVSELTPGTTYHFRTVATNFGGTVQGPEGTFTTPEVPVISQSAASGVTGTSAMLSASVQPGFRATTYHFEYGITSAYGTSTPESGSVGSDNAPRTVTAEVTNLAPGVTYHYRVVANNSVGTSAGPDQAFTTPFSLPPTPTPKPAVTCKKGLVKRHGRCVKPRHTKRARHTGGHR
jgi:phosphodiesterase/alkaline phosphatase D-like protein